MDEGALLNVSASFERIALAIERDGIDSHAIERIAGLASVRFARGRIGAPAGKAAVEVSVPDWRSYHAYDGESHAVALARCLRELAYMAKAERLGFDRERLDAAIGIAEDPSTYSADHLKSARNTLRAFVKYGRPGDQRERAKQYILDINANLEDR